VLPTVLTLKPVRGSFVEHATPKLSGCESSAASASNVIPGATVTLTRNGTPIPFAARAFGMSEGDLAIPPDFALHLGDIIRATQTLCELTSAPSGTRVEVFAT